MSQITEPIQSRRGQGEVFERPFIRIVFQKGLPQDTGLNGCRVEDVISAAMDRLRQYQAGPLACDENEAAIRCLQSARKSLEERILRRQEQGVFSTYICHEAVRTEDEEHDFSATGA